MIEGDIILFGFIPTMDWLRRWDSKQLRSPNLSDGHDFTMPYFVEGLVFYFFSNAVDGLKLFFRSNITAIPDEQQLDNERNVQKSFHLGDANLPAVVEPRGSYLVWATAHTSPQKTLYPHLGILLIGIF